MDGGQSGPRRADKAGFAIAAALIGLALVVGWDAAQHAAAPAYSRIGPGAAAYAIAAGLALLGLATAIAAWRGSPAASEPFDLPPVLMILAGVAGLCLAVAFGAGFVPGTVILFAATAQAFRPGRLPLDLAIGFVLALTIYLVFNKLLSLSLPEGPIERLF